MKKEKRLTDLKREAIILAAIAEFKDNGFQGTSMDKIAARANVSKRTVYNHFASKDILFEEITDALWNRSIKATELAYEPTTPLREQLIRIAWQEVELLASEEFASLSKVYITECMNSPELAEKALERFSQTETGLSQWISDAIKDKKLKKVDPLFASDQFMAMIKTFTFWPQTLANAPMPDKKELKHIIETATDMFISYYEK